MQKRLHRAAWATERRFYVTGASLFVGFCAARPLLVWATSDGSRRCVGRGSAVGAFRPLDKASVGCGPDAGR